MRIHEMLSGLRGDVAVKLLGDDLALLQGKAREVEAVLRGIPGCADLAVEQVTGQPVLRVRTDPAALARHGVRAAEVLAFVEAMAGIPAGEVLEGQVRVPLVVSLPEEVRSDPAALGALLFAAPSGERVPLSRLARVERTEGPSTITREWGRRRVTVQCNVRGRDMGGFVEEARRAVAAAVRLPPDGTRIAWGGQFENLERARLRLAVVVPGSLALVFALLYLSLRSVRLSLLVFTGVPLAVSGGVAALWVRGMPFSIPAAVGFIALSGVAVLNGLVMITFIRQLRRGGAPLEESVVTGSLVRLRPVLMTALVASLGFVPMAAATGMGAEVQKPLATVVIGGVLSSTLLTLVVLPVLYGWFEPRGAAEEEPA
jgi:cobalt-zinc-cadmium resistance protein CzcA